MPCYCTPFLFLCHDCECERAYLKMQYPNNPIQSKYPTYGSFGNYHTHFKVDLFRIHNFLKKSIRLLRHAKIMF